MPVGGTYQLDSLVVHDVFAIDTVVQRAGKESLGPGPSYDVLDDDVRHDKDGQLLRPAIDRRRALQPVESSERFASRAMRSQTWRGDRQRARKWCRRAVAPARTRRRLKITTAGERPQSVEYAQDF